MISVIVLTYNQEQYIGKTLDSILMQDVVEEYEILIGNDCSTDHTADICQQYKDQYKDKITVINHSKNLGLVANFIETLKLAKGRYTALCDGDDYWIDPLKLSKQIDCFDANADCVIVHTGRLLLTNDGFIEQPYLESGESAIELLFGNYITVPTAMFRMDVLRDWLVKYEQLYMKFQWRMQDYPLWLYLGSKGKVHYIKENTAVYRVLPNTLSREHTHNKAYLFDKSILSIKEYFAPMYFNSGSTNVGMRFSEHIFHMRKRMLLNYKWIAREQFFALCKTPLNVWWYILKNKI